MRRRLWCILGSRLPGVGVVLQATAGQSLSPDPISPGQDGFAATGVDVSRGEIAQALVGTGEIAVLEAMAPHCVSVRSLGQARRRGGEAWASNSVRKVAAP
jgi:hypothetical protein